MEGSSQKLSTRYTRTWVRQNLSPLGYHRIDDRDTPPEEIVKMKDYLMNNVSPDGPIDTESLRSKIETTTGVDHDTADKLLNLSMNMSESATAGGVRAWNETMWRSGCYDATFHKLSVMFGSRVFSVFDTPWRLVDFGEDKCLYGNKPDYTSFVRLESTLTACLFCQNMGTKWNT